MDPVPAPTTDEEDEYCDRLLFDSLDEDGSNQITKAELVKALKQTGLQLTDPLLKDVNANLESMRRDHIIDFGTFRKIIAPANDYIGCALRRQFVIPDFEAFAKNLKEIFNECVHEQGGKVADYIPELATANPKHFGVSFCSVDGQRFDMGNVDIPFSIQSTSKPLTYLIAMQELGEKHVHRFIGREPSGRNFNELCLNSEKIPHNPCINSGAIMAASLVRKEEEQAARFRHVMNTWKRLTGGGYLTFSQTVYLSERATADRNFCLAYMMQEVGSFEYGREPDKPPRPWKDSELLKTLELYFQCCSIQTNARSHAVVAATLAKGGVCPLSNDKIFDPSYVSNATALMLSCGMYDYSGEWAYQIGLPAKSGVSGSLLIVVPNIGGFSVYSPALDKLGNSVRGIAFAKALVKRFNFHLFDQMNGIVSSKSAKINPTIPSSMMAQNELSELLNSASKGDLTLIRAMVSQGVDVNMADYDGRTALHLAASEGQIETVKFLVRSKAAIQPVDRWGGTPYTDAVREGHTEIAKYLQALLDKSNSRGGRRPMSVLGMSSPKNLKHGGMIKQENNSLNVRFHPKQ